MHIIQNSSITWSMFACVLVYVAYAHGDVPVCNEISILESKKHVNPIYIKVYRMCISVKARNSLNIVKKSLRKV